jgi:hypothetical protein
MLFIFLLSISCMSVCAVGQFDKVICLEDVRRFLQDDSLFFDEQQGKKVKLYLENNKLPDEVYKEFFDSLVQRTLRHVTIRNTMEAATSELYAPFMRKKLGDSLFIITTVPFILSALFGLGLGVFSLGLSKTSPDMGAQCAKLSHILLASSVLMACCELFLHVDDEISEDDYMKNMESKLLLFGDYLTTNRKLAEKADEAAQPAIDT